MIINSSVKPISVEIIKTDNAKNKVIVALRGDIKEEINIDLLTKKEQKSYNYEEVKVVSKNRLNLVKSIEDNFNNWFEKGKKIEKLENEIEAKQKEINKLIGEYKQVDINQEVKEGIVVSYDAVSDLYLDNMALSDETKQLKSDTLNALDAIAELYMMMMMS